jgi:hypothetical protein
MPRREPPLEKPLTARQIRKGLDEEGYITGVVEIDLEEILSLDADGWLDLLSKKLVGDDLLMDISYRVVGHRRPSGIHIEVIGNPSESLALAQEPGVLDWNPGEE